MSLLSRYSCIPTYHYYVFICPVSAPFTHPLYFSGAMHSPLPECFCPLLMLCACPLFPPLGRNRFMDGQYRPMRVCKIHPSFLGSSVGRRGPCLELAHTQIDVHHFQLQFIRPALKAPLSFSSPMQCPVEQVMCPFLGNTFSRSDAGNAR